MLELSMGMRDVSTGAFEGTEGERAAARMHGGRVSDGYNVYKV